MFTGWSDVKPGTYNITVGAGGQQASQGFVGSRGEDSLISSAEGFVYVQAFGGGGGGDRDSCLAGQSGGSGGGGGGCEDWWGWVFGTGIQGNSGGHGQGDGIKSAGCISPPSCPTPL